MTDLHSLREMLEKADGPDRAIDSAIVKALVPDAIIGEYIKGEGNDIVFHAQELGIADKQSCPEYTASLDADISLVERVLPGWRIDQIGQWESPTLAKRGKWYAILVHPEIQGEPTVARRNHAEKPSIALLTAMVKALIQEKENET